MKKFLIFKTDRLGDLLNISPIISNIKKNNKMNEITLICSKYNSSVAEYYKNELNFVVYQKPFIFFLLKNFKLIFYKKYDFVLQLDGKKHSYLISILVNSYNKLCLQFIKNKKIFGKIFKIKRPNFFINLFFNHKEISEEDYDQVNNKNFHYLNLYFKLLKKIKIEIISKDHFLPFNNATIISKFHKNYILIHIDKRWDSFPNSIYLPLVEKINTISKENNIVISSNPGGNNVYNLIKKEFFTNQNIEFIQGTNLHDTISLVYYSLTCISSHSGLIVHSAAAFKKNIIDIVAPNIFNELDRWIPFNINYKRFDINNFADCDFDFKT